MRFYFRLLFLDEARWLTYSYAFLGGVHGPVEPGIMKLGLGEAQIRPEIVLLSLLDRLLEVYLRDGVVLEKCQTVTPFPVNYPVPVEQGALVVSRFHHLAANRILLYKRTWNYPEDCAAKVDRENFVDGS